MKLRDHRLFRGLIVSRISWCWSRTEQMLEPVKGQMLWEGDGTVDEVEIEAAQLQIAAESADAKIGASTRQNQAESLRPSFSKPIWFSLHGIAFPRNRALTVTLAYRTRGNGSQGMLDKNVSTSCIPGRGIPVTRHPSKKRAS